MGISTTKRIKQKNDFLEAIINAQQEMICRFLPDTTLTFVNQAYCRFFNQPEEKLIGRRWLDFIPEKDWPLLIDQLDMVGKTGKIFAYEHEVLTVEKKKSWQKWTDIPIYDEFGELQEFQSVGLDITAQKEAEQNLQEERDRLDSILKTIDHVVWTAELNPFKPIFVSDPVLEITGYGPNSFYKDNNIISKLISIDELERVRGEIQGVLKEGFFSSDFKIRTRSGEEKFVHFKAWHVIGKGGLPSRLEGVLSDISAQKRYEEKLITLNNSKDRIMATVAHDLRNPISGILSLCNMLEQKKKDSENLFYIDLIKRSSQAALEIMEELLEVAEMESQNFSLTTQKVCLNDLIPEVLEQFESDANEKGIRLYKDIPDKALYADLNIKKFSRVMENLISNALKFTNEKGTVTVALSDQGEKVLIRVSDTGIGIPKELHNYLFEKFTRAKRFGLKGEKTHGLGMYITKQIVELHKGRLYFESKEHKGATFFIELKKSS
ncbi:MAG: PAS domain-containing sensor histidine kinase [Bacteroides sp.]|jgi:PAS domain S-box-containing protein|nr:PAS domain-containing sensor histidine kinase [Bacteroides sp.]